MYKGYLIDLDGTMYRGEEQIEEASDFVKALESAAFHIYSLRITQLVNQNKWQKTCSFRYSSESRASIHNEYGNSKLHLRT